MKAVQPLICCFGCVFIAAIAVAVARSNAQSSHKAIEPPSWRQPPPSEAGSGAPQPLLLDLKTWELTELDGTRIEGEINREKARWERYYAYLATHHPQEHERLRPKTPEMLAAIQRAVQEGHQPESLEQRLLKIQDPVKRAELLQSIESILNPRPVTDEMRRALDASPAGPWSNVMQPYP